MSNARLVRNAAPDSTGGWRSKKGVPVPAPRAACATTAPSRWREPDGDPAGAALLQKLERRSVDPHRPGDDHFVDLTGTQRIPQRGRWLVVPVGPHVEELVPTDDPVGEAPAALGALQAGGDVGGERGGPTSSARRSTFITSKYRAVRLA